MADQKHTLRLALNDPGVFTPRRHDVGPEGDETETVVEWQARAVAAYLREWADEIEGRLKQQASSTLRGFADLIDEREA